MDAGARHARRERRVLLLLTFVQLLIFMQLQDMMWAKKGEK